jgi:hypothetical protein
MAATVWPNKVPSEPYRQFVASKPTIRPTMLAMSACGLVGMLLNDAGVALPAIMAGFALPMLVARLVEKPGPLAQEASTLPVEVSNG